MSLNSELLSKILQHFITNVLDPNKRQDLIQYILTILKANPQEGEKLNKTNIALSFEIFKSLKSIMELIDKGERGLLTGDLSNQLIYAIHKSLTPLVEGLNNLDKGNNKDVLISQFYDSICKIAFDGLFRLPKNGIKNPEYENPQNLFERQLLLEDESNDIAIDKFLHIYEDLDNMGLSFNLLFAKNYIVNWFPNLCKAIKEEQEQCLLGDLKGERKFYGTYITRISAEKAAILSLTELMKHILKLVQKKKDDLDETPQSYYIVAKFLFDSIGKAVNSQMLSDIEEEILKDKEKKLITGGMNQMQIEGENAGEPTDFESSNEKKKSAAITKKLLRKKMDSDLHNDLGIPRDVQIKIGSLLVYLMKETVKTHNDDGFMQNLLTTSYTKIKNKMQYIGVLNVNEDFLISMISKIEKDDSLFMHIDRCLPMIFKPAPWQDHDIGGYYQRPTNFMRIQGSILQERCIKYADLQPTFNVLDLLAQTPWRINKKVLEVIEILWEEGGGVGEIPLKNYNFNNYVYQYQIHECKNFAEKQKLMKKIQNQRDIHSLKCNFNLKLNVARAFKDINRFYFPHNIDFRGRIYPIPPHLNHISADICRGLLEFADGKPIGKNGLVWLKIHLANKMGKDKMSMPERILYVDSILPLVERCTKDPLKYRDWLQVEDSWQTLAAMNDLCNALNSDNPEEYISHLHIHQDGSCNGLQHYAALGRDIGGATQVNLTNSDKPGDIYTHVANKVQEKVDEDAENPASQHHNIAKKLVGNVKRKIVKQTVMTSVYGVTFIGARKQIHKQLKDKAFLNDEENEPYVASHYITTLTLNTIRDLFSGAHDIKKWLIQCAGLIAETSNPVSWITPLGLPVVQPYRAKSQMDVISTIIQRVTISNNSDLVSIVLIHY